MMRITKGALLLIPLLVGALFAFKFGAEDYLSGTSSVSWAADAGLYMSYYERFGLTEISLVTTTENLFGPLLILSAVDGNTFGVFFLNIVIFVMAYVLLRKNLTVKPVVLVACIWLNPLFLVSLIAVNKEITGFVAVAFYACYLASEKRWYLVLAMLAALFVRWQLILVILVFEILRSPINPFRRRRGLTVLLLVASMSVAYPFVSDVVESATPGNVSERQAETSGGLVQRANEVQAHFFGYLLVAAPKMLANWFGNLVRVGNVVLDPYSVDLEDPYNSLVIPGHQLAMVVVVLLLLLKKRFTLESDLIYFGIIYSIIFSAAPFIQYRYFFPVYCIFMLELARRRADKKPAHRAIVAASTPPQLTISAQ